MDLEEIKALVKKVNFSRADFINFLMESIGSENLEAVRFLIKVDSNINFEVIYGDGTPLSYAVLKENIPIVLELIEAGADPNYELRWDENYMPLYLAASTGNLDIVKLLIQAGADVNCVWYGNYALSVAAMSGHEDVYQYLYPLTNDELHEGIEEELSLGLRVKCIEELADPEIIRLNQAIYGEDLYTFRKIINGEVNINAHDSYGNTPLIEACIKANPIIIRELLNADANPNTRNYDNETPLMRVVGEVSYRLEVCRELVQAGADINAQDNDGRTALMNAANNGSASSVKLLLDMGAHKSIQDNDGKTALDYAYLHAHEDYSWATNVDYPAVIDNLEQ
jgi:ankyrin repeat protein